MDVCNVAVKLRLTTGLGRAEAVVLGVTLRPDGTLTEQ